MSIVALDGLHVGELEIRRTKSPVELLDIVPLYMGSFPFTERRTVESMSQALALEIVYFYRIFLKNKCIGMMHFWILSSVVYGEHFAVDPDLRNQGNGRLLLRTVLANLEKPLLIEVEPPESDLQMRRLKFYEREGLAVVKSDYKQPPYQISLPDVPLYLMSSEPNLSPQLLAQAIEELRGLVYRTDRVPKKPY